MGPNLQIISRVWQFLGGKLRYTVWQRESCLFVYSEYNIHSRYIYNSKTLLKMLLHVINLVTARVSIVWARVLVRSYILANSEGWYSKGQGAGYKLHAW